VALPADLQMHEGYGLNATPNKPVVVLLHGGGGSIYHMTAPGSVWFSEPGVPASRYNYNYTAPLPVYQDLGWQAYPGVGLHHFSTDSLKSVRSWRSFLSSQGYRTVTYSQLDPNGFLARPLAELGPVLDAVRSRFPGAKIVLLGHSRGGLLIRKYLKDNAGNPARVGGIVGVITLHSPHQGSSVANLAAAKTAIELIAGGLAPIVAGALFGVRTLLDSLGYYLELSVGGPFLTALANGEGPLPGVSYFTYGGTSVRLGRIVGWWHMPESSWPQWRWPPFHHVIRGDEEGLLRLLTAWVYSPLTAFPEMRNYVGDMLTTGETARLPFSVHRTNYVNHAEALWDPNLQQQVLGNLATMAA
jgi:hypothetical protein